MIVQEIDIKNYAKPVCQYSHLGHYNFSLKIKSGDTLIQNKGLEIGLSIMVSVSALCYFQIP